MSTESEETDLQGEKLREYTEKYKIRRQKRQRKTETLRETETDKAKVNKHNKILTFGKSG